MRAFRSAAISLVCSMILFAQLAPANFDIRFDPDAKLQTGVQIPYRITINDALGKAVVQAKVTLSIERPDHTQESTYKAPMVTSGEYVAKPIFPFSGQWNVTVHVERDNRESVRTNTYTVPD